MNPYAAYKAEHTVTNSKTAQVVMLYDGITRIIRQAKGAILDNNIEQRCHLLEKAGQVVLGLQAALDFEQGNIATLLDGYYNDIYARLHSINRSNSTDACDALMKDIKTMRDAWQFAHDETLSCPTTSPAAPEPGGLQVSI